MLKRIEEIRKQAEEFSAHHLEQLEQFRVSMLGKSGIITQLFEEFKNIPPAQKREIGQRLNELKNIINDKIIFYREQFELKNTSEVIHDLTLPGGGLKTGTRHPISIVRDEIVSIFNKIGYSVSEGPEIEDDWHVFSALNFPQNHPARDMQDTFFIESDPDIVLRTHTSSVQVRAMETSKPPIRIVMPGRVFRNEAISARAHCIFHQVEGLYIDHEVSFADLKQTILFFAREMFGEKTEIRLRPSYFPFTEPSAEVDVSCRICGGKGCNVCKYTGWLEIMGCGMVDPAVLDYSGIDSKEFTGFAFGMGIERIAMLRYQVRDLRMYFENDVRFLNQFISAI